jgi:hypothetical protein
VTCVHNCVPVRRWWRVRWVCVRCDAVFATDVSGLVSECVTAGAETVLQQ